tara:strand:- start:4200 stop:4910 length:711 start_codon:yes stop_codon:yes gene_type:complete
MKKPSDHFTLTDREKHLLTMRVELPSTHKPLAPFSGENTQQYHFDEVEVLARKSHALTGQTWAICDLLSLIHERQAEADLLALEEGRENPESLQSLESLPGELETMLEERGLVAIPKWVLKPVFEKMMDLMLLELKQSEGTGAKAKGEQKIRKNRQHYLRFLLVEKLRNDEKLSIENACGEAADLSEGTFIDASGCAFRYSYQKVRRELSEGSLSYYLPVTPNVRNRLSRTILPSD